LVALGRRHLLQRLEESGVCSSATSWRQKNELDAFINNFWMHAYRCYLGEVMVKIVGSGSFKIFGFFFAKRFAYLVNRLIGKEK